MVDALSEQLGDAVLLRRQADHLRRDGLRVRAGVLCPAFDNELRKHAATKKNLVAYDERMKEQYWKD